MQLTEFEQRLRAAAQRVDTSSMAEVARTTARQAQSARIRVQVRPTANGARLTAQGDRAQLQRMRQALQQNLATRGRQIARDAASALRP